MANVISFSIESENPTKELNKAKKEKGEVVQFVPVKGSVLLDGISDEMLEFLMLYCEEYEKIHED